MPGEQITTAERGWRTRAACRDHDPELFFPVEERGAHADRQTAAAKTICAGCPVRAACLDEALDRMPYGIAGGLTPEERRLVRVGRRSRGVVLDVPPSATRTEVRRVGLAALRLGQAPREVMALCRVTDSTVRRWQDRLREEARMTSAPARSVATCPVPTRPLGRAGDGSAAATAAPVRISQNTPLQGTRVMEGHRG